MTGDDCMKKPKTDFKIIACSILAIVLYFVLPNLTAPILDFFQVDAKTMPGLYKYIYLFAWEIVNAGIIFLLFHKFIEEGWKDLKKHHQEYFNTYFKYWILALAIMVFSNLVISLLNHGNIAGNEETIRELFKTNPIYIFFASVMIAPFVEELVFRQGIRNLIKNDTLFIIISGLVFGGLHVVGNINTMVDWLYLIPYCNFGFVFAYTLVKSKNIFVPASLHFIHNGILMSLQFFILIFS